MNSPRFTRIFTASFLALVCGALASCSVDSSGPGTTGASMGSTLGSSDASDYYYHRQGGFTYVFQNVEHITSPTGVQSTLVGANDTVRTMGYYGIAPSGDSMFRLTITYRVSAQYAGRNLMDMYYVCKGTTQKGGFIDGDPINVGGRGIVRNMDKRPRPVSTDTILAGVVGRIRTVTDDFTNNSNFVWQTDTLWYSQHGDSTYIWERFAGATQLSKSRVLFCQDFIHNADWQYNMIQFESNTWCRVHNGENDLTMTVPAGTFPHTARVEYYTPDVSENMPITEFKYYAVGVGVIYEQDKWSVTSDGINYSDEDFTRSLISLTHN